MFVNPSRAHVLTNAPPRGLKKHCVFIWCDVCGTECNVSVFDRVNNSTVAVVLSSYFSLGGESYDIKVCVFAGSYFNIGISWEPLVFRSSNVLAQWRILQAAACHCSLTLGHGEAQPPFQWHFRDNAKIITLATMGHFYFDQILSLSHTASLDGGSHFVPADVTPVSFQQITLKTGFSIFKFFFFFGCRFFIDLRGIKSAPFLS